MHLHDLTIKKFHDGLKKGDFSALEIAKAHFDWIEHYDANIGAFLSLGKDDAYLMAEQADLAIARGEEVSPIAGVPIALKDNITVKGGISTAGSKILEHHRGVYDATVVEKLKNDKAVILGKTNMDEFAMGSSTENSAFKKTHNPHNLEYVPGGSSGGSAAAVAAHMALAALGSDTGGSIRQPAAFCGVVGFKPTYGAVSRYGLIAMASSLDQIGPMTKTVEDAAMLFASIAGKDQFDATSASASVYDASLWQPKLEDVRKLTIGIPDEYFSDGVDPAVLAGVQQAIKDIESLGIKTKPVRLPHTKYSVACYYIIMPAEVSSNLARFDGMRYGDRGKGSSVWEAYNSAKSHGFGTETKRRVILGTFVLSSGHYDAYYTQAQKMRALMKKDFDEAFKEVDMILGPTSPTLPFKIGEKVTDPLAMYLSDIFTIPANMAGLPAISIPVKGIEGLPIGFQLIGKQWREKDILGVGQFYERLHTPSS